MAQTFSLPVRVRFVDTDASGRIHYTAMFRFFEAAEAEFFRSLGQVYRPDREIAFPRVHVDCDYRAAVLNDTELRIDVNTGRIGSSSVTLLFRAYDVSGLVANGSITFVCLDVKTQAAIGLPGTLRDKLQLFLEEGAAN